MYPTKTIKLTATILALLFHGCGQSEVSLDGLESEPAAESSENTLDSTNTQQDNTSEPTEDDTVTDSEESNDEVSESGEDTPLDGECSLILRAEIRDESGPCSSCNGGDYITVVGIIENPCTASLIYQSEKDCLVSQFTLHNTGAGSSSEYPMTCQDEVHHELLDADGWVTRTRPAGRLSNGDYELTVQFEDVDRTERSITFTVQ